MELQFYATVWSVPDATWQKSGHCREGACCAATRYDCSSEMLDWPMGIEKPVWLVGRAEALSRYSCAIIGLPLPKTRQSSKVEGRCPLDAQNIRSLAFAGSPRRCPLTRTPLVRFPTKHAFFSAHILKDSARAGQCSGGFLKRANISSKC
jgi:hypothetical protein